jgi:hypothetical protein
LARTQRRRRIRCRLPCQVIQGPRRTIPAAVLSLSEGGFGLETTERVEQGDPIRLHIQAQGTAPEVKVEAIVWYDNPAPRAHRNGELRLLGCFHSPGTPAVPLDRSKSPDPSILRAVRR